MKTIKDLIVFFNKIPAKSFCKHQLQSGNKMCAIGHINFSINGIASYSLNKPDARTLLTSLNISTQDLAQANNFSRSSKIGVLKFLKSRL